MDVLATQLLGTITLLVQPFNLAALLAGLVVGLLGARLMTRANMDGAAPLALLFPVAALLDPATALILLASAWAAAPVASASPGSAGRVLGTAALVVAIVVVATGPAAVLLPKLAAADKVALLAATAAIAVICHGGAQVTGWVSALALIALGIAIELSPWRPIDSAQTSPRAVLLGLLALGPAIAVLARPTELANAATSSPLAWPAMLLPLLLFAMPVTATAALLGLALSEHGLSAGHALMTLRPRLALALVLAPLVVTVAVALIMLAARRIPRPGWTPALSPLLLARLAATLVALLSFVALLGLGIERMELVALAIAAMIGAALHWFGQSPAPLVIGLTIGELMRPALAPALKAGITDTRSRVLAACAGLAIIVALVWPWLRRVVRDRMD